MIEGNIDVRSTGRGETTQHEENINRADKNWSTVGLGWSRKLGWRLSSHSLTRYVPTYVCTLWWSIGQLALPKKTWTVMAGYSIGERWARDPIDRYCRSVSPHARHPMPFRLQQPDVEGTMGLTSYFPSPAPCFIRIRGCTT